MRSLNATTLLLSSEWKWIEPQQSSSFLTKSCSHAAALSDTSNMVYSLFFSMSGCQGKDLALFFVFFSIADLDMFFFPEESPPKISSIVLFLDMIPVGKAPQTKHWAAPALTPAERRDWLLWINKSRTPRPRPKTTRRYQTSVSLYKTKLISTIAFERSFWCRNFWFH